MGSGHGDDKGENIIDKCIERLVHERTPWKRCHRFQFVINKQLRQHKQESERVHAIH